MNCCVRKHPPKALKGTSINSPFIELLILKRVDMNSFVFFGISLHLAACHSVTMPALLPHAAQPSAKEILQNFLKDNL